MFKNGKDALVKNLYLIVFIHGYNDLFKVLKV
jgi:hypothetical protein